MLIRVGEICLNTFYRVYTVLLNDKFRLQAYSTNGTSTSTMTKWDPKYNCQWAEWPKHCDMGRGEEEWLRGTIQHFLDISSRVRKVVIITLQGKYILHPGYKRNDSYWEYIGYALKRTDTDTAVSILTIVVCTCCNVTQHSALGSN